MTKQRPRRVGLGMKPREVVSANVVQPEEHFEPVPAAVEGDVEGGGLQPSSLQILDSEPQEEGAAAENEPIVAQNAFLEPPPAVPQEAFDTLAALMKKSEVMSANDPRNFTSADTISMIEAAKTATPLEEDTIPIYRCIQKATPRPTIADIERYIDDGAKVELAPNGEVKITAPVYYGELPNGEYRATVRIGECYAEGCRQQAEADGVSLEDWLTNHLGSYLEAWWGAPAAK